MPTTMLTGSAPARLPAAPITFFVESAHIDGQFEIVVPPEVICHTPRPGMLIVPTVAQPFMLSIRPRRDAVFPGSATVHVTAIAAGGVPEDQERVVLPAVPVAGLPSVDLLTISPGTGHVELSRPSAPERVSLSPLGEAAMTVGRSMMPARPGPVTDRPAIRVLVDCSASMLPAARAGWLSAAVELLAGIVPLVGSSSDLEPVLVGAQVRRIRGASSVVAEQVTAAILSEPLTTGFTVPDLPPGGGAVFTFAVTDGPLPRDSAHAVILADPSAARVIERMAPGATVLGDTADRLLADDDRLAVVVRSLLSPLLLTIVGGSA